MNADLLARNIAAHWVQSGLIAVAALVAIRLLKSGDPRWRLAALQLTFACTLLLPLIQPWRPELSLDNDMFATAVTTAATSGFDVTGVAALRFQGFDATATVLGAVLAGIVAAAVVAIWRHPSSAPIPHTGREIPTPEAAARS